MKQKKLINILNIWLVLFILIQPFLDMYMALIGEKLDLFGISIATLIRTVTTTIVFLIVIFLQIKNKYRLKYLFAVLGYMLVVITYTLLHHFNIVNSNGYFATQGIYNVLTEIMYVWHLVVPVIIMYIVAIIKPDKEDIKKTLIIVTTTIALCIIITNIFKLSFASYSPENNIVKYNVFDWFKKGQVPYKESLSKGLFVSANQIGALLAVLLPITLYYTLKNNNRLYVLVILAQIIAMCLVGTRVANYGWMIGFTGVGIVYVTLLLLKRIEKTDIFVILGLMGVVIVGTLLYTNSPSKNRDFASTYEGMYEEELEVMSQNGEYIEVTVFKEMLKDEAILEEYVGTKTENIKYDAMCKYVEENYKFQYITEKYVKKIYPYTDDPEFWLEIFSEPFVVKADNRGRQVKIIQRIKNNNDNFVLDTILGMGATPMNGREYMIENDLISHYYNLGIVGIMLFILPYFTGIVIALLRCKNLQQIFNFEYIVCSLSVIETIFIGYFAGHVIDEYIVTIFVAIIAGNIFNVNFKEVEKIESKT